MTERPEAYKAQKKRARAQRIHQTWEGHYDELLDGELTLAEILGHSDEKLMDVADLGLMLIQVGKFEQARKILTGLPLLEPYVPYFHMLLGILHDRLGDLWKGLEEYEAAIELCESSDPPAELLPHVLLNQAKLLIRTGRLTDAAEVMSRLDSGEFPEQDPRFEREVKGILHHLEAVQSEGRPSA
jgi:tetratricopeptide (TPR) repeat protein